MAEKRTYYCLRCQHRFESDHRQGEVVERSCPKCGSNAVRAETNASARTREAS